MKKEPIDFFVCKEHGEVVYNVKRNGIITDMNCRLGCDIEDVFEAREAIGWFFTWEELGVDISALNDFRA
jgi:hypothetical protein